MSNFDRWLLCGVIVAFALLTALAVFVRTAEANHWDEEDVVFAAAFCAEEQAGRTLMDISKEMKPTVRRDTGCSAQNATASWQVLVSRHGFPLPLYCVVDRAGDTAVLLKWNVTSFPPAIATQPYTITYGVPRADVICAALDGSLLRRIPPRVGEGDGGSAGTPTKGWAGAKGQPI